MTIVTPDSSEDELVAVLDRIGGYVAAAGGEVVSVSRESPWGRRRLAYPIRYSSRDVRDGFYTLFTINLPPAGVVAIERELKLTDRLMRYLIVQATPKAPEPPSEGEAEGEAPAGEAPVAEAAAAVASEGAAPMEAPAAAAEAPVEEPETPAEAPAEESDGSSAEPTKSSSADQEGEAAEES